MGILEDAFWPQERASHVLEIHGIYSGDLDYTFIYLDDILITSANEEEHCLHLKEVLKRIKDNGISLNFEKSSFNKSKVDYLGYEIGSEGIKINTDRVKFLENITTKARRDISKILGLINWYRV